MRAINHHLFVRISVAACVLVIAAAVVGCSSSSDEDKAGVETRDKPVELVLANHDDSSEAVGAWADAVEKLSDGSIRIRVSNSWRQGESNYEQATLRDVGRGNVAAGDRRGAGLRRGGRDVLPAARGADADRQPRARAARAPRRRRRSGAGRNGEAGTDGTCSAAHGVAPAGWPHTRPDGTRGLRGRQRVHPRGKDGAGDLRGARRATRPPPDRAVVHGRRSRGRSAGTARPAGAGTRRRSDHRERRPVAPADDHRHEPTTPSTSSRRASRPHCATQSSRRSTARAGS